MGWHDGRTLPCNRGDKNDGDEDEEKILGVVVAERMKIISILEEKDENI